MSRWLVLSLGMGIALAALYVLLTGPVPGARRATSPQKSPREEIDDRSRADLRDALRDADDERRNAR